MKIFAEHFGVVKTPWVCFVAESLDEKKELDDLYLSLDYDDYPVDIFAQWEQNGYKLMVQVGVP